MVRGLPKGLVEWWQRAAGRAAGVASWRIWALAALAGLLTSIGVILFTEAIEALTLFAYGEGTTLLAQGARDLSPWRAFLAPVVGSAVVAVILYVGYKTKILPGARLQGVAEVIEARASPQAVPKLRTGVANTVACVTALGTGASAGREGPLVAMGGAIAGVLSRRFGVTARDTRTLLGCCAAAAVSAGFDAPIAGVLFALEVILSNYALSVFGPVTLASIVALLVSQGSAEDLHRFLIPDYGLSGPYDVPLAAILGVFCGVVALLFLQGAARGRTMIRRLTARRWMSPAATPLIAGVGMGGLAIFLPEVLGVGYEATSRAINGQYTLALLFVLLVVKGLATIMCLSCRFGTGVFSGGIYLGAIAGAAFGAILQLLIPDIAASPTFYAMIGMGAVSGAIIGAPISTTLIVFELTGDYGMTAGLMLAVGIATLMVQIFFGSSWFHYQLNQRGYDLSDGPQGVILQTIRVRDVMRPMQADASPLEEGAPRLYVSQTLGEALATITDEGVNGLPVVAKEGENQIIGTLTQIRALKVYNEALVESHIEHHR